MRLSVALVELIDQLLEADYERIILREKMNGSKELAIAEFLPHETAGFPGRSTWSAKRGGGSASGQGDG